jgi:SAM-dependent methyltransferase
LERAYWRDSPTEALGLETLANLLNKMGEVRVFLAYLEKVPQLLADRGTVLELGAGQGWSSCLYKRLFPQAHVIATDPSPYAIGSVGYCERIVGTAIDRHSACKSYATAEPDASVDLIFCFAAAHHFADHPGTLRELHRILKLQRLVPSLSRLLPFCGTFVFTKLA